MHQHAWTWLGHVSPSGRAMYHCEQCGLFDPAPLKAEHESRPCEPGKYMGQFYIEGKVVRVMYRPD